MKEIKLEDHVLRAMESMTKDDMKPLLDNIDINFSENFGRNADSFEARDFTKKAVGVYGGLYNSLKDKLENNRSPKNPTEDEFFRLYMTYVASEATVQLLKNGDENVMSMSLGRRRLPADFNISTNKTDQNTLSDAITHLYKRVLNSHSVESIKKEIKSYFEMLSNYSLTKLNEPFVSKFKNKFEQVTVSGKGFKIQGIKELVEEETKEKGLDTEGSRHLKGLQEVTFAPVYKENIVANEEGITLVETELSCLLHYDPIEQRNPAEGAFQQFLLFEGDKGTGKSMLAKYGLTLAKEISEKENLPVSLVKIEFEDRWQYGPLENLRKQLRQISEGNRMYVVFMDEIDKKIPSGHDKEGYRNDVVGEFLRFRGEGDYINKGNYLFLATTNNPGGIYGPILDVFRREHVKGPQTAEEKATVLYNNLRTGIELGYVQIEDSEWKEIGELLGKSPITGRGLVNIAKGAKKKYKKIFSDVPYSIRASKQDNIIKSILVKDGDIYTTTKDDVMNSIIREVEKRITENKSYV